MNQTEVDNRDWSKLSSGQQIYQLESEVEQLSPAVRPSFPDRTRHWNFNGDSKPVNMASGAPGIDPRRWQ